MAPLKAHAATATEVAADAALSSLLRHALLEASVHDPDLTATLARSGISVSSPRLPGAGDPEREIKSCSGPEEHGRPGNIDCELHFELLKKISELKAANFRLERQVARTREDASSYEDVALELDADLNASKAENTRNFAVITKLELQTAAAAARLVYAEASIVQLQAQLAGTDGHHIEQDRRLARHLPAQSSAKLYSGPATFSRENSSRSQAPTHASTSTSSFPVSREGFFKDLAKSIQARHESGARYTALPAVCPSPTAVTHSTCSLVPGLCRDSSPTNVGHAIDGTEDSEGAELEGSIDRMGAESEGVEDSDSEGAESEGVEEDAESMEKEDVIFDERRTHSNYYVRGLMSKAMNERIQRQFILLHLKYETAALFNAT